LLLPLLLWLLRVTHNGRCCVRSGAESGASSRFRVAVCFFRFRVWFRF
jgi:hypothetical protein